MKYMIASDIHGSKYYCRYLLDRFGAEAPDRLLILGDTLYHGPRNSLPRDYDPDGVKNMLNEIKDCIIAVRGNCDSEVDQFVLEFPMMADYCVLDVGGTLVFATHGHRYMPEDLLRKGSDDVYLYGHTHIAEISSKDGHLILNPGSVSIPKSGENSYMIIEDGVATLKNLDGEVLASVRLTKEGV